VSTKTGAEKRFQSKKLMTKENRMGPMVKSRKPMKFGRRKA
jgi:hypothetical protein